MFCQNCGNKIDEGASFCKDCGAQTNINTIDNLTNKDSNNVEKDLLEDDISQNNGNDNKNDLTIEDVVGKSVTYYKEQFARIDRGEKPSFRWASLFLLPFFLLYRKQYGIFKKYLMPYYIFFIITTIIQVAIIFASPSLILDIMEGDYSGILGVFSIAAILSFVGLIWGIFIFIMSIRIGLKFNILYYEYVKNVIKSNDLDVNKKCGVSKKNVIIFIIIISCLAFAPYAIATQYIYKWIETNGATTLYDGLYMENDENMPLDSISDRDSYDNIVSLMGMTIEIVEAIYSPKKLEFYESWQGTDFYIFNDFEIPMGLYFETDGDYLSSNCSGIDVLVNHLFSIESVGDTLITKSFLDNFFGEISDINEYEDGEGYYLAYEDMTNYIYFFVDCNVNGKIEEEAYGEIRNIN